MYNLYTDPKEQRSSGHRYFEWGFAAVKPMLSQHLLTYVGYPRKNIGLAIPQ